MILDSRTISSSAARGMICHTALAAAIALCASGCIGYTGAARSVTPDVLKRERGWVSVDGVELLRQEADHDCGPTALAMVVRHYVPSLSATEIKRGFGIDRRASAAELRDRATELGLSAFVIEGTVEDLAHELKQQRPVIVGMAKPTATGAVSHYEVVVGIHPQTRRILTLDPAVGWRQNSLLEFLKEWTSTGNVLIIVLPSKPAASPRMRPQAARALVSDVRELRRSRLGSAARPASSLRAATDAAGLRGGSVQRAMRRATVAS